MRENAQEMDLHRLLANTVFPVPGTSSSSTWPLAIRDASIRLMTSSFPTMTLAMFSRTLPAKAATFFASNSLT